MRGNSDPKFSPDVFYSDAIEFLKNEMEAGTGYEQLAEIVDETVYVFVDHGMAAIAMEFAGEIAQYLVF